MPVLKKYNSTNFFKHTFCEFLQVDDFNFPENSNYKSKSDSNYFYTNEGVYRKSNHWGRVANCRWKLITNESYKNQKIVTGFAKWSDFYPINSSQKLFFIQVDFKNHKVNLKAKTEESNQYLFTYSEAQKRVQQINHLLKNDKWATYFNEEMNLIKEKVIEKFINSNQSLVSIKSGFR